MREVGLCHLWKTDCNKYITKFNFLLPKFVRRNPQTLHAPVHRFFGSEPDSWIIITTRTYKVNYTNSKVRVCVCVCVCKTLGQVYFHPKNCFPNQNNKKLIQHNRKTARNCYAKHFRVPWEKFGLDFQKLCSKHTKWILRIQKFEFVCVYT